MSDSEFITMLEERLTRGGELFLTLDEWRRLEGLAKEHLRGIFYQQEIMVRSTDLAGAIGAAKHFIARDVARRMSE